MNMEPRMTTLLQPGDRVGGHEILRHLATGGSSEVYASRLATGELRALKIVATDKGLAERVHARMAQAGEALSLLVHRNVVRYYDADTWRDRLWLSLELVEGVTLRERLRAGPPPLEELLDWILQVCDGIAEAHRLEVIHRGLSPDNLLVTPGGLVKIIGFGVVKLQGYGFKTTSEQQLGTAMSMAPEQTRGAEAHVLMDVYAVGHLLYEGIAGVHATGRGERNMIQIVDWQLHGQPRPLRELAPWVPSDLEALVHQALEKEPGRRPPSIAELAARVRLAVSRLRAPERRVARNVLAPADEAYALTGPMPVQEAPAPASAAATPAATSQDRAALLPAAQRTLVSAAIPDPAPAAARASVTSIPGPAVPAEVRSSDVAVESAARPSNVTPRRGLGPALVVGAVALAGAAVSWMFLGGVASGPRAAAGLGAASVPRPAISAVPVAPAPGPTSRAAAPPTATASASAAPARPPSPRPPAPAARPRPRTPPFAKE